MKKPRQKRCLDLYCGAGGAAMGYYRAGFEVVGVDIKHQPHYPFEFIKSEALDYLDKHNGVWREFDFIHASPPCQAFSSMTRGRWKNRINKHPDFIAALREIFMINSATYVIENVVGAHLHNPFLLCGSIFGLETKGGNQLRRHRLFETSFPIGLIPPCRHNNLSAIGVYGGGQHPLHRKRKRSIDLANSYNQDFGVTAKKEAMGIDWMNCKELCQAIPPAYTEFIGRRLMAILKGRTQ